MIANRLASAATLLFALTLIEAAAPALFPILVAVALVVLLSVQWAAAIFFTLASGRDPTIQSLNARAGDALALALGQTAGAVVGLLVVGRAINVIGPVPREVFLLGLSFALLMLAWPAVNWLVIWKPWNSGS
jgi:hypothetical protein